MDSSDESSSILKRKQNSFPEESRKIPRLIDDSDDAESSSSEEEDQNEFVEDDFLVADENEDYVVPKRKESNALKRLVRAKNKFQLDEEDEILINENNAENYVAAKEIVAGKSIVIDTEYNGSEDEEDDMNQFIIEEENRENKSLRNRDSATSRREKAGPSYDQVQEAIDIFGDDYDEFDDFDEMGQVEEKHKMPEGINVNESFDHRSIVEKFLLSKDEQIRATDRPERLQLRLVDRGKVVGKERRKEAEWIFSQLKVKNRIISSYSYSVEIIDSIRDILSFLQVLL